MKRDFYVEAAACSLPVGFGIHKSAGVGQFIGDMTGINDFRRGAQHMSEGRIFRGLGSMALGTLWGGLTLTGAGALGSLGFRAARTLLRPKNIKATGSALKTGWKNVSQFARGSIFGGRSGRIHSTPTAFAKNPVANVFGKIQQNVPGANRLAVDMANKSTTAAGRWAANHRLASGLATFGVGGTAASMAVNSGYDEQGRRPTNAPFMQGIDRSNQSNPGGGFSSMVAGQYQAPSWFS